MHPRWFSRTAVSAAAVQLSDREVVARDTKIRVQLVNELQNVTMSSRQPISLIDMELGTLLPGDILDANDRVVFRRGLKLTKDLLSLWERRGSAQLFVASDSDSTAAGGTKVDARLAYDPAYLKETQAWFQQIDGELQSLADKFSGEDTLTLRPIEDSFDKCWKLIKQDSAVVIHEALLGAADESESGKLARRSSALAAISSIVAFEQGLSREECSKVALAGLLQDLALFPKILNRFQEAFDRPEEKLTVVARHSYFTTDLLNARASVPDLVKIIINQTHEQMDGSGYPRGLQGHIINPLARIVNLTDAFLSLTSSSGPNPGYVAGDAIAYLLHHTSNEVFDRDVMRSLLSVMTLYGIGSQVVLDGNQAAVIVRGMANNPLQAVVAVAVEGKPNQVETFDLVDSGRSIIWASDRCAFVEAHTSTSQDDGRSAVAGNALR